MPRTSVETAGLHDAPGPARMGATLHHSRWGGPDVGWLPLGPAGRRSFVELCRHWDGSPTEPVRTASIPKASGMPAALRRGYRERATAHSVGEARGRKQSGAAGELRRPLFHAPRGRACPQARRIARRRMGAADAHNDNLARGGQVPFCLKIIYEDRGRHNAGHRPEQTAALCVSHS